MKQLDYMRSFWSHNYSKSFWSHSKRIILQDPTLLKRFSSFRSPLFQSAPVQQNGHFGRSMASERQWAFHTGTAKRARLFHFGCGRVPANHASMAEEQQSPVEDLQQLLLLRPSQLFMAYHKEFSKKFNLLKPYESSLPVETFLENHAQSVKAMLCFSKTPVTPDLLRLLPSLQLVVTVGANVSHIDIPACHRQGIAVVNNASINSEDTADYGVGLLIDVMRKISSGDRYVRQGAWPVTGDYPLGFKLGNKRVGIVGYGNIGSKIAKRLTPFGCKISYTSRNKKQSVPFDFYPNAYELACHSDILVISCLLTEQTHHMVNKDVMAALGKDGIIINIGRGPIVDEKELVKCLINGEIGGAGLDVFEYEPHIPEELLGLDNVMLSPHRAAYTEENFLNSFNLVMGNLDAFFSNKPLLSPVVQANE